MARDDSRRLGNIIPSVALGCHSPLLFQRSYWWRGLNQIRSNALFTTRLRALAKSMPYTDTMLNKDMYRPRRDPKLAWACLFIATMSFLCVIPSSELSLVRTLSTVSCSHFCTVTYLGTTGAARHAVVLPSGIRKDRRPEKSYKAGKM